MWVGSDGGAPDVLVGVGAVDDRVDEFTSPGSPVGGVPGAGSDAVPSSAVDDVRAEPPNVVRAGAPRSPLVDDADADPADVVSSAWATPAPLAKAAPTPSVSAPAPSHA